ncbi:DUF1653 domain-containing protein [Gymnodinialimonas sp. 2305UL16-5]|uniref:DUF1653 domain-containing protein n=1 Tax=Gymnodinialimonas mytili TaxID=3126503 RepID=UPI00309B34E8
MDDPTSTDQGRQDGAWAPTDPSDWRPTHRHKKGGLYRVLAGGIDEAERKPVVIYDDREGQIWVRSAEEFWDGRFTQLDSQGR